MYTTINDILNKIDQKKIITLLNDEGRSPAAVDFSDETDLCTVRLNKIIVEESAYIDGFLSSYVLPLPETPVILKTICEDRVIYKLYQRRHAADMPESLVKQMSDGDKKLIMIQQNKLRLAFETIETKGAAAEIIVNKSEADKIFNDDTWSKF